MGIIIPKRVARRMGIVPGERIVVEFRRKTPEQVFGILKDVNLDPEKAKVFREDED